MVNVLADLAIESEAATATALRLARAYDEEDNALRRFATAVLKYWICKRATPHAAESLECLGGNGYVEESPMPRLLRDAPLNGIWEGSGNVMALDVLRALAREPEGLPAFLAECELARGGNARARRPPRHASRRPPDEWSARRGVEDLALAFQASLLVRHAPPAVADAFCAGRLGEARGRVFGTLPAGVDGDSILERALATLDLHDERGMHEPEAEPLVQRPRRVALGHHQAEGRHVGDRQRALEQRAADAPVRGVAEHLDDPRAVERRVAGQRADQDRARHRAVGRDGEAAAAQQRPELAPVT